MKMFKLLLLCTFTYGAAAFSEDPPPPLNPNDPAYVQTLQWWNESGRKPASSMTFGNADLSKDFVDFRLKLIGIDKDDRRANADGKAYPSAKTADQLDALMTEAEAHYAELSPDMKYFMGQVLVLKPLRGMAWRLRPLFENGFVLNTNHTMHGPAVTMLRDMAQGMRTYFPTEMWEAMFEYVTVPSSKMTKADQFKSIHAYQQFLDKEVFPAVNHYAGQIAEIYMTARKGNFKPFVFDNKVFFSKGGLQNDFDTKRMNRFDGYGLPEIAVTLGAMYDFLHDGYFFTSYNYDALLHVMGDFGRRFGINQVVNDPGITPKQKADIIRARNAEGFMTLKKGEFGRRHMHDYAYQALRSSTFYYREAYKMLQGQAPNTGMIFNPVHYQTNASPRLREGLDTMWALVNGTTTISSPVTGETIDVDLPKFYASPPNNLVDLMPTDFNDKDPKELEVKGHPELKYRNYFYQMPTGWNNSAWAPYVPSAAGKPADYMRTANRVVFMSYGAGLVFGHLDFFVR